MNDTPRTNDIIEQVKCFRTSSAIYSLEQFSRLLERELTAAREEKVNYKERFERLAKEYAIETQQLTEQRDRLSDLVRQFIYILDITEESDSGRLFHPTNITSCRAGDLQKIGELVEALRRASRTTITTDLETPPYER